ncbi:MAG: class IV adenylate cyclase [Planctomycetes bacterium]|nr:class IV adenylate cyclase [Planctomycetota bacterium]
MSIASNAVEREIEAKFRLADPQPVRDRLLELCAARPPATCELNRIFDTPERRLLAADCGLRVRETRPTAGSNPPTATLTYKGPCDSGSIKSRPEIETVVANAAALTAILERLGFEPVIVYEKRRETWLLDECEVCLDELPQLGWFVEIEGPAAAAIAAAAQRLGLTPASTVRETYVELAARHGATTADGQKQLVFER